MSDLTDRLRKPMWIGAARPQFRQDAVRLEAADRIDELEAENERLRDSCELLAEAMGPPATGEELRAHVKGRRDAETQRRIGAWVQEHGQMHEGRRWSGPEQSRWADCGGCGLPLAWHPYPVFGGLRREAIEAWAALRAGEEPGKGSAKPDQTGGEQ